MSDQPTKEPCSACYGRGQTEKSATVMERRRVADGVYKLVTVHLGSGCLKCGGVAFVTPGEGK